jgi:hypothetical protein
MFVDDNDLDQLVPPAPLRKQGFVRLMRSPESQELLRDPLAFGLLALIAFRARWHSGAAISDSAEGGHIAGQQQ